MNDEEVERAIQFILEQQTRITSEMQELEMTLQQKEKFASQLSRLTDVVNKMTDIVGRVIDVQTNSTEEMSAIAHKVVELGEKDKEIEERLDAFILFVERYISEGRSQADTSSEHL
jgi:methyl-accepting chemotaxis protein